MLSNPKKNTEFRIHNGRLCLFHKTENHLDYWKQYWQDGKIIHNNLKSDSTDLLEFNDLFDRYIPATKQDIVLEAGCGAGLVVNAFHNRGNNIIGIDYEPQVIEMLKQHFPRIDYRKGDILNMEFADESIGYYISLGVLEHFENAEVQKKAFEEAFRVLKKGGIAFISVPYLNPARKKHFERVRKTRTQQNDSYNFHQYYYSIAEFSSLLKAHGFEIIETYGYACQAFVNRELPALKWASKKMPWRLKKKLNHFLNDTPSEYIRNRYAHMMMYVCKK